MKRVIAVVLTLTLMVAAVFCTSASADMGDLIRFIPTEIEVSENEVLVDGYFVNLNSDATVRNFTNFAMEIYLDGDLLVEGDFGDINQFSISPLGVMHQKFRFTGPHDLNEGTYSCGDKFYASFTCDYQYI